MFALLNRELEHRDFLVGQSISACDYFLFMLAILADELSKPPLSFKHLARYLRKLAKREAIISVCIKEHLSLADYQ